MKKITMKIICGFIVLMCCFNLSSQSKKYPKVTEKTKTEDGMMYPSYSHPYKWNENISGEPVLFDEVWGYVMLSEIQNTKVNVFGCMLPLERDLYVKENATVKDLI